MYSKIKLFALTCALGFGLAASAAAPPVTTPDLAATTQGQRPIHYYVLGSGDKVAMYYATIHGNEPAGTDLLLRLTQHLEEFPQQMRGWKVVVIPTLNPDGMAADTRCNLNNVDLNRNFPVSDHPGRNGRGSLEEPRSSEICKTICRYGTIDASGQPSETETRALLSLIDEYQPSRILTIHQLNGDAPKGVLLPHPRTYPDRPEGFPSGTGQLDPDPDDGAAGEKAAELAEHMLAAGNLSGWEIGPIGVGKGSFGAWVTEAMPQIPTITYELSAYDKVRKPELRTYTEDRNWDRNKGALLAFLAPVSDFVTSQQSRSRF